MNGYLVRRSVLIVFKNGYKVISDPQNSVILIQRRPRGSEIFHISAERPYIKIISLLLQTCRQEQRDDNESRYPVFHYLTKFGL